MTTFDERESAFEAKFAKDEELQFRTHARRNKLIGHWAAGLLGRSGPEADLYAQEVLAADFARAGHEDVVAKLLADLGARTSEAEVRAKLAEYEIAAKAQLMRDA